MKKTIPMPLHISKRARETLQYAMAIMDIEKSKPKPEIRLSEADRKRLSQPYERPWRKTYHWIDSKVMYGQK